MAKNIQPKLADSLSVFVEQIEKIEKNNVLLLKVNEELIQKMEQLSNYEPKLDFKPLEIINDKQIVALEELNHKLSQVLIEHTLILEREKLQSSSMFSRLRALVIFLFFMTIMACLLAISFYNKKHKSSTLNDQSHLERTMEQQ